jgi:hypothetical protein
MVRIPFLQKNKLPQKKDFRDILAGIEQANDLEISQIIQAVIRRYKTVFPDWEVIFLSLPLQPETRAELLEEAIAQLKKT